MDAAGFEPAGTWALTARGQATVRARYATPDETREGTAPAADIHFTPVGDIPASTAIAYDASSHAITTAVSGMDRVIALDGQNTGSVTVEGPVTERIPDTICDMTRTVTVGFAFSSSDVLVETITQRFAYQTAMGEDCTHPASLCTCGEVVAFGLTSDPPNPFYDSIRDVQTANGALVLDQAQVESLAELVVLYEIDGERM